MSQRIIITGAFRFPEGDAASARVVGTAKALRKAGFAVEFAGWEDQERPEDKQPEGGYSYQGFKYTSQSDLREQKLSPWKRLVRYLLMGSNTLKWLKSTDLTDVSSIVAYHGSSIFLLRLMFFCFKKNIKLFFDCTEWYDSKNLVGGRLGIVSIDNAIRMYLINNIIGQGIVISSYLEGYYKNKNCRILKVPPLIDIADAKWHSEDTNTHQPNAGDSLKLVYAGTPAKKDLLGNALRGLKILHAEGCKIELHLLGPSRKALLECLDGEESVLHEIEDMLVLHGRVKQMDVPKLVAKADFSILLRPQERYAQAGFSTKFVESLMASVPVIANVTGDIASFIKDNESGILIESETPEDFAKGVRRAINMPIEKKQSMRCNARRLAEESFDFRLYEESLRVLFDDNPSFN